MKAMKGLYRKVFPSKGASQMTGTWVRIVEKGDKFEHDTYSWKCHTETHYFHTKKF